jgi:hypothetical protein
MGFDPQTYGSVVAAILHLDGDGERLMPLATAGAGSDEARTLIRQAGIRQAGIGQAGIRQAGARQLFPRSRAPEAAMAGLYLYFDCWTEAHETAQDVAGPEGSYWHAIVHRQEPDAWNSGYWFRQVGAHAIFPTLRDAAAAIGLPVGPRWKPEEFIEICEQARQRPGSELERQALAVQRAEWQLLFDYCAR